MERPLLKSSAVFQYHYKDNIVSGKHTYKNCYMRLYRNEPGEIFLEIRNGRDKTILNEQLINVKIHKNFMHEGKACIKFLNKGLHVMISNAPSSQLFDFLKLIMIKMFIGNKRVKYAKTKYKHSRPPYTRDISPIRKEDLQKVKEKVNQPEKPPAEGSRAFKRPFEEERVTEAEAKRNCLMMMIPREVLDDEQQKILDAVKFGQSIFFSGAAGTGKSYLIKKIVDVLPPRATFVTASTGVAACQINGMTLHQFAGIGRGDGPYKYCVTLASRREEAMIWRRCQHLIIDEISMVQGEFFEKLEFIARIVRKNQKPFGGIQLILTGDFFQLPPIGNTFKYCFETDAWEKCVMRCFELTKVHRQKDPELINILDEIRMGSVSKETCNKLMATSDQDMEMDGILPTLLCNSLSDAQMHNGLKLMGLWGAPMTYKAVDDPPFHPEFKDRNFPAPDYISLKPGAQVMLIKTVAKDLVNGARGVVLEFDGDGFPVVKFNARTETIRRALFLNRMKDGSVLRRFQLPLSLAWAFSIHKAQGMTLDCVEVDLSRVRGPGLTYTALSRVKSLDCLRVVDFKPSLVKADPRVLKFYEKFQENMEISKMFWS